ncbi:WhiB family transcriptional regulator [Streptomyces sp. TRM68416]|uniref:WhiB family transcriptional regulator n=1 Tax=Streptomyces sp. TRM68416 TaxID=2758412 RepID=UPI001CB74E13|nr:WhiB family transcriptional regulator [Streptomyces sp. TRM68416]
MHAPPRYADSDPWTERAACHDTDPETFFPLPGTSGGVDKEAVAKRLCGTCPVARECLREALLNDEGAGIWGGFNARERRELLRIADTLESTSAQLAAYLAGGGHRITATPRERPAYVWYLRRHGWTPRRIAGALGVSFGQVQQAWQLAELASSCTHGPVSGMPNPRAPRKRVRRTAATESAAREGVVGAERPAIPGGAAPARPLSDHRHPTPAAAPGDGARLRPSAHHPAGPVATNRNGAERGVPARGEQRRIGPAAGEPSGPRPRSADRDVLGAADTRRARLPVGYKRDRGPGAPAPVRPPATAERGREPFPAHPGQLSDSGGRRPGSTPPEPRRRQADPTRGREPAGTAHARGAAASRREGTPATRNAPQPTPTPTPPPPDRPRVSITTGVPQERVRMSVGSGDARSVVRAGRGRVAVGSGSGRVSVVVRRAGVAVFVKRGGSA